MEVKIKPKIVGIERIMQLLNAYNEHIEKAQSILQELSKVEVKLLASVDRYDNLTATEIASVITETDMN